MVKLPSSIWKDRRMEEHPSVHIKRIVCPVCQKADNLRYVAEVYRIETTWEVVGNERLIEGFTGEPKLLGTVMATCKCGHEWRLRGVKRIEQIDRPQKGEKSW